MLPRCKGILLRQEGLRRPTLAWSIVPVAVVSVNDTKRPGDPVSRGTQAWKTGSSHARLNAGGRAAPPPAESSRGGLFLYKMSNIRTGNRAQAYGVMVKNRILPMRSDIWGESGTAQFDSLEFPDASDQ
jgi:hypothetical protein